MNSSLRLSLTAAACIFCALSFQATQAQNAPTLKPDRLLEALRAPRRAPNPTPPPAEIKVPVEKFFDTLKEAKSEQAYNELLANTRLLENKENVGILVNKTDQALALYGKPTSFEIYDNYSVGNRLLVATYITYHPVQPLRWRFVYYKGEQTWALIDIRVDDVLEDLISN